MDSLGEIKVYMDVEELVVRNFEFRKDGISILNARSDRVDPCI